MVSYRFVPISSQKGVLERCLDIGKASINVILQFSGEHR